jgi:hypothetical protein
MKLAVISFSGNVGKTTIARHLLAPRLPGASIISIESINAAEDEERVIKGRQFADLQEYLQVVDDVVVDIGASNIEDMLALMRRYRGSHEDFDVFIVPSVPSLKQQRDTIATLAELASLGIPVHKVRLIFNMVDDRAELRQAFEPLLSFLQEAPLARYSLDCCLEFNEVYARVNGTGADLKAVAADPTNFKALITATEDSSERLALAQQLATRRLAIGVVPELDACFAALDLYDEAAGPLPASSETAAS